MNKIKALIVDDDKDILSAAEMYLRRNGITADCLCDPNQISAYINKENYDVILLDMNFEAGERSGREGLSWLKYILEKDPQAAVIMITAYSGIDLAVEALKTGAADFIEKPWHNEKLLSSIRNMANLQSSRKEVKRLKNLTKALNNKLDLPFNELLGKSPKMMEVFSIIQKIANADANVLITGENGTGKELVARAIYRTSLRAEQVFIPVDIGAIPESLIEAELFGHEAGSFTGAGKQRIGYFEAADNGTLFLDEISNISMGIGAKLLRTLESRTITRIGQSKSFPINIRLICAGNKDLRELVNRRQFREDLLFRINTVEIQLPPLRERPEDIPLLAEHFLKLYKNKYNAPNKSFSNNALEKLLSYDWPGNIRELRHLIERAVLLSDSENINENDFNLDYGNQTLTEVKENLNLFELEKTAIFKAINKSGNNLSRLADILGISRQSLYRKLEKHDIKI